MERRLIEVENNFQGKFESDKDARLASDLVLFKQHDCLNRRFMGPIIHFDEDKVTGLYHFTHSGFYWSSELVDKIREGHKPSNDFLNFIDFRYSHTPNDRVPTSENIRGRIDELYKIKESGYTDAVEEELEITRARCPHTNQSVKHITNDHINRKAIGCDDCDAFIRWEGQKDGMHYLENPLRISNIPPKYLDPSWVKIA